MPQNSCRRAPPGEARTLCAGRPQPFPRTSPAVTAPRPRPTPPAPADSHAGPPAELNAKAPDRRSPRRTRRPRGRGSQAANQRPPRSCTSRAAYRLGWGMGAAASRSHGPSSDSPGAIQTPPRPSRSIRSAQQENTSTGRPSTTATCGTSSWPKPAGAVSGGRTSHASRSALHAWPITPRPPAAPSATRAVTSMWKPSPPGSATTYGSRHASSIQASRSSVSYQRPSAHSSGPSWARVHVTRSLDVARPIRCTSPRSARDTPV